MYPSGNDGDSCGRSYSDRGYPGGRQDSMALAFAKAMNLTQNRVQFTPDVLPSDIVGFSMFYQGKRGICLSAGAVMCKPVSCR